jgi:protein-tyrosine phosphatase
LEKAFNMIYSIPNSYSQSSASTTFHMPRILKSSLITAIALIVIGSYLVPFLLGCAIIAISSLGVVQYPHILPNSLLYEVAIADLIVRAKLTRFLPRINQTWWHKITPRIILGGIPLANYDHLRELKKMGVTAVYSILEDFEATSSTFFSTPVQQKNWSEEGISYHRLKCQDMMAMTLKEIDKAIQWLRDQTAKGVAYVHCKAGRGRSAMIVIAYLMRYYKMTLSQAVDIVSSRRSVMTLRPCQYDRLREYEQHLHFPTSQ